MKSPIEIPSEIDEKLKKNHNLLSRQILKTQIFLVLQQISAMMIILLDLLFLLLLLPFSSRPILFLIFLFSFIGSAIFLLYFLIRYIAETIDIHREYSLKEKQNLNYLFEELLLIVKIYTSKFRFFKWRPSWKSLFQDNKASMEVKMGYILKREKLYFSFILLSSSNIFIALLSITDFFADFGLLIGRDIVVVLIIISICLYAFISYLILKNTNKWIKGYQELNVWEELLDKYDIIPKEGYIALLDKDFNNVGFPNDKYCVNCGNLLEPNAKFCIYCGRRIESN